MAEPVDSFIPPEPGPSSVLARDLSPLPANACQAFIHAYVPEGGLVWDPFCRSETVGRAAARQGKRSLLSDFNPLITFAVEARLSVVSPRQIDRALQALADAPTLQTTLAEHISSLYTGACAACGAPVSVQAFTWNIEEDIPTQKEYHCPRCNQERVDPVTEEERVALARVEERGRAYWTVVERLGASDGPLAPLAHRLLDLYTARAIYSLMTILAKIELTVTDRPARAALMLALLDAMEQCAKHHLDERGQRQRLSMARPGGASTPTCIELNCWLAFSQACAAQRQRLERQPLAERSTESTTIHVQSGSARRVAAGLSEGSINLILASPPTMDWGDMLPLTYLWTGWLLGKEEARRFSVEYLLHPRRSSDWAWFSVAMEKSLRAMLPALAPQGKIIFCLPLTGLAYVTVLVLAAASAGLRLENVAYQPAPGDALRRPPALGALSGYCYLRFGPQPGAPEPAGEIVPETHRRAVQAATQLVAARGEPTPYVWLHLAMLQSLSYCGLLSQLAAHLAGDPAPWDRLRAIMTALDHDGERGLRFLAVSGEEPATDTQALARQRGWWWLVDPAKATTPLTDRVEWATYTVLCTTPMTTVHAVQRVVYALHPGLLTPQPGIIEATLESYATAVSPTQWRLRRSEALANRTLEHAEMMGLLVGMAHRVGLRVYVSPVEMADRRHGGELRSMLSANERTGSLDEVLPDEAGQPPDVVWRANGEPMQLFQVEWTAMLSEHLRCRGANLGELQRFLVTPAERAGLIQFKLEQMPLLRRCLDQQGWLFIRYDSLRRLAQATALTTTDLKQISGLAQRPDEMGLQLTLL